MKNPAADPRTTRHRLSRPSASVGVRARMKCCLPEPLTRIAQQRTQTLDEMRARLPTQCDGGVKRHSTGFKETWIGYKLHLDTANGIVPVAAILTAASTHDSQVAIPLARTSEQRVVWLYDLMDPAHRRAAYHL